MARDSHSTCSSFWTMVLISMIELLGVILRPTTLSPAGPSRTWSSPSRTASPWASPSHVRCPRNWSTSMDCPRYVRIWHYVNVLYLYYIKHKTLPDFMRTLLGVFISFSPAVTLLFWDVHVSVTKIAKLYERRPIDWYYNRKKMLKHILNIKSMW